MKINKIIIFLSILMLSGCFGGPKYTWVKGGLNEQGKEFIIEDSTCTAESYKAAPAISISGDNDDLAQAVLAGQMKKVRNKVYDGCMLGKGWEKQPIQ